MSDIEDNKDELEVLIDDAVIDKAKDGEIEVPGNDTQPEDWKVQLDAAQKRAEEAETRREEAERLRVSEAERHARETAQVRATAASAEMTAIDNAIANVEHEKADAKAEYSKAMESGDYEAAAEAQAKLADIAVRSQRIKEGKAAIERRAEDARQQSDPIEQYAAQLSAKSASWVRNHPEVVTDVSKRTALERAHYGALSEGYVVDSSEYFAHLDRKMGFGKEEQRADLMHEPAQTRTQSAPAAPPSRESATTPSNPSQTRIRLSAAQREIAAACGMTDAEYAKHLVAIQRENGATTH